MSFWFNTRRMDRQAPKYEDEDSLLAMWESGKHWTSSGVIIKSRELKLALPSRDINCSFLGMGNRLGVQEHVNGALKAGLWLASGP